MENTGKAFTTLIEGLSQIDNSNLTSEVTLLNARYSSVKKAQRKGTIAFEEANHHINQVNQGLLELVISESFNMKNIITHTIGDQLRGNEKIESYLINLIGETEFEGKNGEWHFFYAGIYIIILTDEYHNRMRIISPILDKANLENLKKKFILKLMAANFSSALDAKYALWKKGLWGCFVHPIDSLSQNHFNSGVLQVANLSINYGQTYSSTNLMFNL